MTKRTYTVSGIRPVLGHQPGEEFTAELDERHEERLLRIGAITRKTKKKTEPDE